ncbi:putative bifunctional diguanylate cyclase/phosphodiesterase [Mycobacterium haemophilum]
MSRTLDELVTAVASELMAATAATAVPISKRVLADLAGHFGIDASFLRHNDHDIHATRLIAEFSQRVVPEPDPIGLVYFSDADPIFAGSENLKEPMVLRPEPANEDYQRRIEAAASVPAVSLAYVPLLSGEITTGVLGFVKYGDREWRTDELHALQAIATLFAQLQARIVAEEQLRYLAEHDDLTGLLNRRALIAHLDQRLANDQRGPVTLLFLDLDRLKAVNDYLGHNAGDRLIEVYADRLREAAEDPTIIARLGGDEFVVVPAEQMEVDAVELLAHRLQARLQESMVIDGETLTRTVSIGVATGLPGRDSTSDLLRWANQAALSAKSGGGGKVVVLSREISAQHALRTEVELHLEGMTDTDLVLHYLPEIDMRTGRILGAEALVRWQHPTRGLLFPDSFIGVAESINLAGKLGRMVMRLSCAEFSRWRSAGVGLDALLRINVSPVQLVAEGFVDTVACTLDEFGLDASMVCLEITESVVVQDIEATRKTLVGLKEVGVHLAIDDFGTGYSVLTHLKSLPVDTIKIDKGFVLELGGNASDLAIVRAIMALAKEFELEVVAEGVETAAAAQVLRGLGCHRAQGFLFSRPVDGVAMESLLTKGVIPVALLTCQSSVPSGHQIHRS